MPPKQQPLPPTTSGPANRVPCPHCGKPNSFAGHGEMIATGNTFTCDHCHLPMQIAGVQMMKVIHVRKPQGQVTAIKRNR
jgi:transcription elongation factor Elf1